MARKIRVLVVDDSLVYRETIARELSKDSDIEVVATATDPYMARDKIIEFRPDVMTLDVEMPRMSGIEFLKKLMPQYPMPVVVVSSVYSNVFDALENGAVDFVAKPHNKSIENFIKELIVKIKVASTCNVRYSHRKDKKIASVSNVSYINKNKIIAIGASTGGTEVISDILKSFREDMPGILITQHMPAVFTDMYAQRLNRTCKLDVKEAEDGDVIEAGKVLLAPGDYHMKVIRGNGIYKVSCSKGDKVNFHRPSVDVLFNSVADIVGKDSIGVILTGMGRDGASGLLKMKESGAFTIAQDEKTSVVYGMPKVAYEIGATSKVLPSEYIAREVCKVLSRS